MLDLNIAVIGAPGSGKSALIRKALGLPDKTASAMCHRKWTIDGTPYVVRLLEMRFDDVHAGERNTIEWPKQCHNVAIPRVDGAITMYDVTNRESLPEVPDMLSECIVRGIALVA